MTDDLGWWTGDRLIVGRKDITRLCGEPEKRMGWLVDMGLPAWQSKVNGVWKCLLSDIQAFNTKQRDRHLKGMSSGF